MALTAELCAAMQPSLETKTLGLDLISVLAESCSATACPHQELLLQVGLSQAGVMRVNASALLRPDMFGRGRLLQEGDASGERLKRQSTLSTAPHHQKKNGLPASTPRVVIG